MTALHSLFGTRRRRERRSAAEHKRSLRFRPGIERLEERKVMDANCPSMLIDDMTELAQLYPTKAQPTVLALNFDGQTANSIAAFSGTNADIQEILFRTSEIFSPFNVEVRRVFGNGVIDISRLGNSTIFIGDDPSRTFSVMGTLKNTRGAYAPSEFTDFPHPGRDRNHAINSDQFNLAFVDPFDGRSNKSNLAISRSIAHEAGHTFGLAHVLSSPGEDVMSCDATTRAFLNTTFNVTNLNYSPEMGKAIETPRLHPVWHQCIYWPNTTIPAAYIDNLIVTQNSFTTLSALLGRRNNTGDEPNVADANAVDPIAAPIHRGLNLATSLTSAIDRIGDYDVYSFTADRAGVVRFEVDSLSGGLVPEVMVFRTNSIVNPGIGVSSATDETSVVAVKGESFRIVVGARDSNSVGQYRVSVDLGSPHGANPTLDIRALAKGPDGAEDQILLEEIVGTFRLSVNGALVYSDRADDISSVTVVGTDDNETFTLKHSLPFAATLKGGLGVNTLAGQNVNSQWLINGLNAGTHNGNISFSNMSNLKGGFWADTFAFTASGSVTGKIDGGFYGGDTLDYSRLSSKVVVNLLTTSATKTSSVVSIDRVIGGSGDDELTGDSAINTLKGGGGADTLKGGGGDDAIYGDAGRDWLYGEGGRDLLDGGADFLSDMLFGDNAGALDEADTYVHHLRWAGSGIGWFPEWETFNPFRPLDILSSYYHWETYF